MDYSMIFASILLTVLLFFWASNVKSKIFRCILLFFLFAAITIGCGFLLGSIGEWLGYVLGAVAAYIAYNRAEEKIREKEEHKKRQIQEEGRRERAALEEKLRRKKAAAEEELRRIKVAAETDTRKQLDVAKQEAATREKRREYYVFSGVLSIKNPDIAAMVREADLAYRELCEISRIFNDRTSFITDKSQIECHIERLVGSADGRDIWQITIVLKPITNPEIKLANLYGNCHTSRERGELDKCEGLLKKYRSFYHSEDGKYTYTTQNRCALPENCDAHSVLLSIWGTHK